MVMGRRFVFLATMMLAIFTFTFVFTAHEPSNTNTFIATVQD